MKSALLKIKRKNAQGFTLIELLVVIGILAVLLAIVLVAINPARQFQQANDTQRRSDVTEILNAVHEYMADNGGNLPTTTVALSSTPTNIGTGSTDVNLCPVLVTKYLADMPIDPSSGTKSYTTGNCAQTATPPVTYSTGYEISVSATDSRVTVCATGQITTPLCVTR